MRFVSCGSLGVSFVLALPALMVWPDFSQISDIPDDNPTTMPNPAVTV
jgi:hypothetical protein